MPEPNAQVHPVFRDILGKHFPSAPASMTPAGIKAEDLIDTVSYRLEPLFEDAPEGGDES